MESNIIHSLQYMVGLVRIRIVEWQSDNNSVPRYANTRGDKHWFAKPCRPFHEIVYAKQKGFPYWPAKVVNNKENSDGQVRFANN